MKSAKASTVSLLVAILFLTLSSLAGASEGLDWFEAPASTLMDGSDSSELTPPDIQRLREAEIDIGISAGVAAQIAEMFTNPALQVGNSLDSETRVYSVQALATAPILEIRLDRTSYVNGDRVNVNSFRLLNPGTETATVELKVWIKFPGIKPISLLNLGADESYSLPAGFDAEFGPFTLFEVTAARTRGTYELSSRMVDPVTARLISESLNAFTIN